MGRSDEMLFSPLKPDAFTALRPDRGVYEYHSVGDESVFGDELTGWQDCGGDAAYLMTITIGTGVSPC